jgi:hypothetical protein
VLFFLTAGCIYNTEEFSEFELQFVSAVVDSVSVLPTLQIHFGVSLDPDTPIDLYIDPPAPFSLQPLSQDTFALVFAQLLSPSTTYHITTAATLRSDTQEELAAGGDTLSFTTFDYTPEQEPNNTPELADTLGFRTIGVVQFSHDTDYYALTALEISDIQMTYNGPECVAELLRSTLGGTLYLYDIKDVTTLQSETTDNDLLLCRVYGRSADAGHGYYQLTLHN